MAIQFARARYISGSTGGSAVRSAAYNGRAAITAERTGEVYYFRHRQAPEHHGVLLPEGAAEQFRNIEALWNTAEAAERRQHPEVRRAGGRAVVADAEAWGALWRDHQIRYFQERGVDVEVDPTAVHPGQHIGPVRMRKSGAEILEHAEEIRRANEAAARDPEQVLAALTRNNATFTERDVDRYLAKFIDDDAERAATKATVLEHQRLVALHDRESGEAAGRFTTRAVREQEQVALTDAAALAGARGSAVSMRIAKVVEDGRQLRTDQKAAFAHAIGAGRLALIEGRAGTGKSYTLAAIHDAHALAGRRGAWRGGQPSVHRHFGGALRR